MSPSSQSVSPPSETGSQESIDGGTAGRYEMSDIHFLSREYSTTNIISYPFSTNIIFLLSCFFLSLSMFFLFPSSFDGDIRYR